MYGQSPLVGADALNHTFEILFMLGMAFLLGLLLGYLLWARYREKLREIAAEKKSTDSRVENILHEFAELKGQHKSVEKQHTILNFKYEELDKQHSGLRANYDTIHLDTERTRTRLEASQGEINHLRAQKEELQNKYEKASTNWQSISKEYAMLKANFERVRDAYESANDEKDVVEEKLDVQTRELIHLQAMHGKVLNELEQIKASGEQLNSDQLRLVQEHEGLQQQLSLYQTTQVETEQSRIQLQESLATVRAENEELQKANHSLTSRYNQLEENYNKLEDNLARMGKSLGSLRGEHEEIGSIHDTLKEEYDSLNGAYAGMRNEMEELGKRYAGLKGEHEELGRSHANLKAEYQLLKEDIAAIKTKNQEINTSYAGLKGEYAALEEVNDRVKKDYKELNNRYHNLSGELRNQEESRQLLDQEYEKLTLIYDEVKKGGGEISNTEYDALKGRYAKLDRSNETILKINNKLQASLSDAELTIEELQDERDRLKKLIAEAEQNTTYAVSANSTKIMGKRVEENDMKIVEGIGPRIESLLYKANIRTWTQLADAKVEDLRDILERAGSRYKMHNPTSWPQQAQFAAENRWEKLKEYQEYLHGGKEPTKAD